MGKKLTLDEVILQFKKIHENKYDYSKVIYRGNKFKVIIICKNEKHGEFLQTPFNHSHGSGCPKCNNEKIRLRLSKPHGNSIRDMRPDLIKYLKNESDADKYAHQSMKKVPLVCPGCQVENLNIRLNDLSNAGFSCKYCSDGISIPEKFGVYLFKQLNIDFETQKAFSWSQRKKYDFYIPSLNVIIETHGGQHYFEISRGKTLKEIQDNDALKMKIAKESGIEHYIVIDCRFSKFDWLKENYIKDLYIFDLGKINWEDILFSCSSSKKVQIWNAYNINNNIKRIAQDFSLDRSTIINYLKIGTIIGKCSYDPKKASIYRHAQLKKGVVQSDLFDNFVKMYDSMTEGYNMTGIPIINISRCCRGINKSAGGFIWRYAEGHEQLQFEQSEEKEIVG